MTYLDRVLAERTDPERRISGFFGPLLSAQFFKHLNLFAGEASDRYLFMPEATLALHSSGFLVRQWMRLMLD